MKRSVSRIYEIFFVLFWAYIEWQITRGNPDPAFKAAAQTVWIIMAVIMLAFIIWNEKERKKDGKE